MRRDRGQVDCFQSATAEAYVSGDGLTFTIVSIRFAIVVITSVSNVLHLAVAIIRASRTSITVSITTIVVAFAAVVFTRRVVASGASRGGWSTSTAWRALTTAT